MFYESQVLHAGFGFEADAAIWLALPAFGTGDRFHCKTGLHQQGQYFVSSEIQHGLCCAKLAAEIQRGFAFLPERASEVKRVDQGERAAVDGLTTICCNSASLRWEVIGMAQYGETEAANAGKVFMTAWSMWTVG